MKTFFSFLAAVLVLLPGAASALRISYSYDVAGRMTAANYNGGSRTAYTYDKNGGLLSRVNSVTPAAVVSPHLAGAYSGLVTNFVPGAGNIGIISLKLLANGTFSGKVTIQGISYAFAGSFNQNGTMVPMHINIDRKPPLTDCLLSLNIDTQGSQQIILGTLTGDINSVVFNSNVTMSADLTNLGGQLMAAGQAGSYTMIFEPSSGVGVPQGTGYATVVISSKGAVTMAGKLPNNVAVTQGSQILGPGIWPLYVPLHSNQGFLIGNMAYSSQGLVPMVGFLDWGKPTTSGTFHPAAFTVAVNAACSRYAAPAAGKRALDFMPTSPNAIFEATLGDLGVSPVMKNVTLDTANKFITPVDANALKLTLATSTGLITGSFKPSPTVTRTLTGIVFQADTFATGFFVGDSESGNFNIETPDP
jgi:YD repeat-containing protein